MAQHSSLIVEDEHTLRRLLEYRLGKQYDVRTASNGEEAIERVNEELPNLIISDIMMPKMDGFALQAALQERQDTRAIPFIFLTAKADETSLLKGRRTGVDDYITKPFDIDQLLSRVDRLLDRTAMFQNQLDAKIGHDFSQKLMPKNSLTYLAIGHGSTHHLVNTVVGISLTGLNHVRAPISSQLVMSWAKAFRPNFTPLASLATSVRRYTRCCRQQTRQLN